MDSTMSKPKPIGRRGVPTYDPDDGELIATATVENPNREYLNAAAHRRGVESPPGDERNRHVYRYDILLSTADADASVSCPYWGSVAEYEGDGDTVNVIHAVEMLALDASTWHNVVCLPTDSTLDSAGDEFLDGFDRLAEEYAIEKPSDAMRVFDSCRLAAKGFEYLGYHADAVDELIAYMNR